MQAELQTVLIYSAIVVGLAAVIPIVSWLLGQRHRGGARDEVYESGIVPTGPAHRRIPPAYYLIALFFLIFDLEVVLLFLWASHYQALGWSGFLHISLFIGILLIALLYPWSQGALNLVMQPRKGRS